MFSFSMFKSLDKMAFVLLIPLCAIAMMIDHPLSSFHQPNSMSNWLGWFLLMCLSAVILVYIVDSCIVYVDVRIFEDHAMLFAGLLFLAFSLYGVSNFYHQLPPSPFGAAWHLTAGCYGFTLLRRNAPTTPSSDKGQTP
ncbi:hypothetical protein KTE26_21700 [Ralstonia mannitolilytica]|uniref:hypothetical protein n=1 Tax=Ralstonia mannitolilytica TaxID=105219 RepID=UPI000CEDBE91|nr:hypothetical protein [Ralstonia mannitolilytica]MBU9581052.1 hypothetical protein [Ralstonia mannitolilytica]